MKQGNICIWLTVTDVFTKVGYMKSCFSIKVKRNREKTEMTKSALSLMISEHILVSPAVQCVPLSTVRGKPSEDRKSLCGNKKRNDIKNGLMETLKNRGERSHYLSK